MHERKGNYMPCKWKRKKGGCHGLLSRGREGKLAEYFTRGDAHTMKNVNLLVFLIVSLPSTSLIRCLFRIFLRFYFLGSLFNPLSFFSRIFLFFSFACCAPLRPRADEKARAERTDGVNPSRAKSKRRTAVS